MPLVKSFMAAHPDAKVDLRLHDSFIDLVDQGIDVTVRIGALDDSRLVARRVGASQRMVLAHSDYLRVLSPGSHAPVDPEDLLAHECIIYTGMSNSNL